MATFRTCKTKSEIKAADAEYERKYGRSPLCPPGHDEYMDRLAERMAAAAAKLDQTVGVRIA